MLISYLSLVSGRARSVARSQSWNQAVPASEAGLEEGMAHLNQTKGRNMVTNGWTHSGGNVYAKSYDLGWARYAVRITNTNAPPAETLGSVEASGSVKVPGAAGEVTRRFRVTTRFRPQIEGLVAQNKVTVQDFAMADSYDSRLGLYSALTARDNTFIGNNSTFPLEMKIQGAAKVYGEIGTGASTGLDLGPLASVGDFAWANDPVNAGDVEPFHHQDDLSAPLSAVVPPFPGPGQPLTNGIVDGVSYKYVLGGGNYQVWPSLTMTTTDKMMVTRDSTLWIMDTFTLTDTAKVIIAPGARLKLYMEKQFYCQGTAQINTGGRPEQFSYYGLNANAEFYMNGLSRFNGTVYAPQAKMDISGLAEFSGGGSCGELVLQGNSKFHYDESLAASREQPFLITSWTEF